MRFGHKGRSAENVGSGPLSVHCSSSSLGYGRSEGGVGLGERLLSTKSRRSDGVTKAESKIATLHFVSRRLSNCGKSMKGGGDDSVRDSTEVREMESKRSGDCGKMKW